MLAWTEATNSHIFHTSIPAVVYLNGTVLFVSGLSIVLRHNIYRMEWPLLITATGWMTLGLGFSRMVYPEAVLEAVKGDDGLVMAVVLCALFFVGTTLCWKGYVGGRL